MDQNSRPVVTEIKGPIAIVSFNRPSERNPLSSSTLHELSNTLAALTSRADIEAIIFTGSHNVFLSGADIRELAQLDPDTATSFSRLGQEVFQRIADARQLTIAAIDGYCMGGGLDLALACDIRVAAKTAVFSHPGAKLGIITGWGGTQRLPKIVGKAAALELMLTARRVSAADALRMGLVTTLSDAPLQDALKLARSYETKNPRFRK